jgi:hypothetical protein
MRKASNSSEISALEQSQFLSCRHRESSANHSVAVDYVLQHTATARLILPEIAEPARRQFGISNRMLDILVSEVLLNRAYVLADIRQVEARSMAQHMWMYRELDTGGLGSFCHDMMGRAPCHRATV